MKTFEFGKRFSRIRVHEQRRHAETAQANEPGNRIGCSYEKAQASYGSCVGTQRTAASGSNPSIQRAILFDRKSADLAVLSPALFPSGGIGNSDAGNRERLFSIPARKPQAGCEFMKNARIAHRTW